METFLFSFSNRGSSCKTDTFAENSRKNSNLTVVLDDLFVCQDSTIVLWIRHRPKFFSLFCRIFLSKLFYCRLCFRWDFLSLRFLSTVTINFSSDFELDFSERKNIDPNIWERQRKSFTCFFRFFVEFSCVELSMTVKAHFCCWSPSFFEFVRTIDNDVCFWAFGICFSLENDDLKRFLLVSSSSAKLIVRLKKCPVFSFLTLFSLIESIWKQNSTIFVCFFLLNLFFCLDVRSSRVSIYLNQRNRQKTHRKFCSTVDD